MMKKYSEGAIFIAKKSTFFIKNHEKSWKIMKDYEKYKSSWLSQTLLRYEESGKNVKYHENICKTTGNHWNMKNNEKKSKKSKKSKKLKKVEKNWKKLKKLEKIEKPRKKLKKSKKVEKIEKNWKNRKKLKKY